MSGLTLKNPWFFSGIIFLAYVAGLWETSIPLTGDQKVYLSAALEMFEKKEWIIPSLFGEANFLKPPFQYWMTIVGWKVFGLSIFGALIPSVLALLSSSILSFEISKKLKLKSPELVAILFASTIGSMTYGSTAQMEIWIVFFLLAAWLAVLTSRLTLAFILVGVMAWVKGPLYPVLWTMSYLVWSLHSIKLKKFWWSLSLGVIVGLSWYLLAARTNQEEMIKQFFLTENIGKMNTKHGSVLELWGEFIFSLFPWGIILFLGCFQEQARERWKLNQKFYLSYAALSAFFFSIFPYRVNSYLYFLTPIMAMLVSEIDLNLSAKLRSFGIGVYSVFFGVIIFSLYQLSIGGWMGMEIAGTALIVSLVFMVGFYKARMEYVVIASLIFVNIIRVSAVQIGEKDVAGLKEIISKKPGEYAYFIQSKDIWHEYGLMSASTGQSLKRIYDKSQLATFLTSGGSVILQEDQHLELPENTSCTNWQRIKRKTKFPIKKLLTNGVMWGDSEVMRNNQICSIHK